ncbi:U-box domain-containing protein 4 [Vigna angularis]|nr:U-box domain-containing protein 4 [Vigna angularis]
MGPHAHQLRSVKLLHLLASSVGCLLPCEDCCMLDQLLLENVSLCWTSAASSPSHAVTATPNYWSVGLCSLQTVNEALQLCVISFQLVWVVAALQTYVESSFLSAIPYKMRAAFHKFFLCLKKFRDSSLFFFAISLSLSNVGSIALDHRHTEKNATAGGHFCVLRRLIFDAVSCGGTSRYRYRQRGGGEGSVGDFSSVASHAEKEERSEKRSEKLSDLLNAAETKTDAEVERKEEALAELKRVVKELREEDFSMRRIAAERVRSLAKEDAEARANLAMLGAIPPLVGMLDSEDAHSQIASLYALLNLGIGNDANKATVVKIGTVHKMLMLKLIESSESNSSVAEAIVANFLGLSALDSNKPIVGSSGAIPFLVSTLKNLEASKTVSQSQSQVKQDALRALYNLSICQSNISVILETDLAWFLVSAIGDMEVSERSLAILSNLVSTPEGRKAIKLI